MGVADRRGVNADTKERRHGAERAGDLDRRALAVCGWVARRKAYPPVARLDADSKRRRRGWVPTRQPPDVTRWLGHLRRGPRQLADAGRNVERRQDRSGDVGGPADLSSSPHRGVRGLHHGHSNRERHLAGNEPWRDDRVLPGTRVKLTCGRVGEVRRALTHSFDDPLRPSAGCAT